MAIDPQIKKFLKDSNGVRRLNPAWTAAQKARAPMNGAAPAPCQQMPNAATALAVVSTVQEMQQQMPEARQADSVTATVEMLQDEDIAAEIGTSGNNVMAQLARIFARYECPVGLLNKLLVLSEFAVMEFLVDDSGSMNQNTDSRDPATGRPMTRWQEVHRRLAMMFEIIAFVPPPGKVYCRFLNMPHVLDLTHGQGEPPERYLQRVHSILANVFRMMPQGTTPARERIAESLQRYPGQSCARYFFGDGQPNGGGMAAHAITQMLITRPNPSQNPFTFLSCTDDDDAVEWMKEAEEAAPFCSECDDYYTEQKEVISGQGAGFPYTYGMHHLCELVAACNPDDLDALDESAPMTASTLSNILGYQLDAQSYKHYFDHFLAAQRSQKVETQLDQLKKSYAQHWPQYFQHFLQCPGPARTLPIVQQYHAQVLDLKRRGM